MLLSLLLLLSLLAPYVSARASWPLALLSIGFPWLYGGTLLYFLRLAFLRRRRAMVPLLPLLLGLPNLPSFLNWHQQRPGSFRILSMNCRYFNALDEARSGVHNNIEASKPWLEGLHPDVVCTQDFSTSHQDENDQIENFLKEGFGLRRFIYYLPSMAIYCRPNMVNHHGLIFPSTFNCYCAADFELGGRMVRVYNLHLQSYQLGRGGEVFSRLSKGIQLRSEQAEIVARDIASSPHPVIVCGDFNDVPNSYPYETIGKGLQDAFVKRGHGLGRTYSGFSPTLRIDNIFIDKRFEVNQFIRVPKQLSDHFPIITDITRLRD